MDLEILRDYLVESRELLQGAQEDVLRLEADPGDDPALASIFRAFHTIKGGAGFLEAPSLVAWAHDLEDLLDKLRGHTLPVTSERIDAILRGMDVITAMFAELSEEREPSAGPEELAAVIRRLAAAEPPAGKIAARREDPAESPADGASAHPPPGARPHAAETPGRTLCGSMPAVSTRS